MPAGSAPSRSGGTRRSRRRSRRRGCRSRGGRRRTCRSRSGWLRAACRSGTTCDYHRGDEHADHLAHVDPSLPCWFLLTTWRARGGRFHLRRQLNLELLRGAAGTAPHSAIGSDRHLARRGRDDTRAARAFHLPISGCSRGRPGASAAQSKVSRARGQTAVAATSIWWTNSTATVDRRRRGTSLACQPIRPPDVKGRVGEPRTWDLCSTRCRDGNHPDVRRGPLPGRPRQKERAVWRNTALSVRSYAP